MDTKPKRLYWNIDHITFMVGKMWALPVVNVVFRGKLCDLDQFNLNNFVNKCLYVWCFGIIHVISKWRFKKIARSNVLRQNESLYSTINVWWMCTCLLSMVQTMSQTNGQQKWIQKKTWKAYYMYILNETETYQMILFILTNLKEYIQTKSN